MAINDNALTTWVDEALLTLDDLCRVTDVGPDWVTERVRSGMLAAHRVDATTWHFDTVALHRVRCMVRLERDFDAVPELAALVADLQDEIERLRGRLRRTGLG